MTGVAIVEKAPERCNSTLKIFLLVWNKNRGRSSNSDQQYIWSNSKSVVVLVHSIGDGLRGGGGVSVSSGTSSSSSGCTDRGDCWRGEAARVLQASNGWAAASYSVRTSEHGGRGGGSAAQPGSRAQLGKEEIQICNDKREMKSLMEEGEFIWKYYQESRNGGESEKRKEGKQWE